MTFYAQAAKVDSRLPDREIDEFDAWEMLLADIPPNFAPMIFREIYRRVQVQQLQPGHIVEAWETVRKNVNAAIARCKSFDKRARDLDVSEREDAEKFNQLVELHNAAVDSLPHEVAAANGFMRKEPVSVPGERKPAPAPAWFKSLQKG
ncbi:hypothetical protein [Rothia sp. (in: high G+C Gram-positive bacteria)]|uniref:hypothetical protein n=1 Tax=Rothia sp. (in: high G+C Gram-positive bacteria) TaxID=1885016 RepID=UPI0025D3310C|nr:hypothetical protein [Rothia sp. (in: high G+C Gram-positive bacteria)]